MPDQRDYTIIGTASLISEDWARETCPDLQNFRLARLADTARVFGKVNPQSLYRGDADWTTMEVASCYLSTMPGVQPIVSVFDVPKAQMSDLIKREYDYEMRLCSYATLDGAEQGQAYGFFGFESDAALDRYRPDAAQDYWPTIRACYSGPVYRDDIYPEARYLECCLRACKAHGAFVYENFLQTTFLANGITSLENYLHT